MRRPRLRDGVALVNSVGHGRSKNVMSRGGVSQPGVTCAKGVANGGKTFPEIFFASLLRGVLGLRVVFSGSDAPHGVKGLASASAQ